VGTLPLRSTMLNGMTRRLRGGACPRLVADKQQTLVHRFAPKVILWHSIADIFDIDAGDRGVASGTPEWGRRVMAHWDDTLRRLTRGGAQVVVILPVWYERSKPRRLDEPGGSVEKLRDLYTRWAARHRQVAVVDVAPLVCPSGPPCPAVNGIDFRPDATHYDDPGGDLVAEYLVRRVPALSRLAGGA
jgi:hypothetical protein